MKTLIAVVTCHKNRAQAEAQRATWVKDIPEGAEVDVRFFLGRDPTGKVTPDTRKPLEVYFDIEDDYDHLALKTQMMRRWAHAHGYDFVLKLDDDVYLQVGRFLKSNYRQHDYTGRLRGASGIWLGAYASGFAYCLSRRAIEALLKDPWNGDKAEDRYVGNVLKDNKIRCYPDYRYTVIRSKANALSGYEGPREGNYIIASCEHDPRDMERIHHAWKTTKAKVITVLPAGELDRVCILIKTFLRDGYMFKVVEGIQRNIPEARMVIVDDGYHSHKKMSFYAALRGMGHTVLILDFDSGFGAKSNAALSHLDRPYTLIASDDFNFNDRAVRGGILRMQKVLDALPEVAVASGRVDNVLYEGYIERGPGYIKETRLDYTKFIKLPETDVEYQLCDLTVNYNLVRSNVLGMNKIHWHEEWKIGGDHFTFYDEIKQAGHKIAFVNGVNINQMPFYAMRMHSEYPQYRARAKQSLPSFFKHYNIEKYIGFDGRVDTL